jgi:REP element-mobilizing transposase RayT
LKYNSHIHNRQSIRIKGYDYSQAGKYFITLNVRNSEDLLGEIINGKVILNQTGMIAEKCWLAIPDHYPDTILHEYIIMPDHLHGIIEIKRNDNEEKSAEYISQKKNEYQKIIPRSIGCIVRGFKTGVTRQLKVSIWQRNYYERIIRSEASYKQIARYIINNPVNFDNNYNIGRNNLKSIGKSKGSKF